MEEDRFEASKLKQQVGSRGNLYSKMFDNTVIKSISEIVNKRNKRQEEKETSADLDSSQIFKNTNQKQKVQEIPLVKDKPNN